MESKELHKKRKHVDREDKISYYKPDAKILRSSKRSRKVLPRRSMRLITKVFLTFYSFNFATDMVFGYCSTIISHILLHISLNVPNLFFLTTSMCFFVPCIASPLPFFF
jgi:hypothetical protein